MAASARRSTPKPHYPGPHRRIRARVAPEVATGRVRCARGADCFFAEEVDGRRVGGFILPGQAWDLGHVDGDPSRWSGPEHRRCNRATNVAERRRPWEPEIVEVVTEPAGVPLDDPRWDAAWLEPLLDLPANAVWPRFMTLPHPRAAGSLGWEFVSFAEERSGRKLRWWQKLVAVRLLEVDAEGRLVWEALILTLARQLGKSWLLRELMLWRLHHSQRFDEPQLVMHTGKDIAICKEVQRPARVWAQQRKDVFKVREVNGQEEIELLADGSRWMVRAKEAVYGYGVSFGVVDEAWKVRSSAIDDGMTPTMVEREQPQLALVSTAHRLATSLMVARRALALEQLETGAGDLLIEWSTPRDAPLDDLDGWRQASPYWTPGRERLIGRQHALLMSGELEDPEEPDPEQSFRSQWLNQWPARVTKLASKFESLIPVGVWDTAVGDVGVPDQSFVAVEDDYGLGAAVAVASTVGDAITVRGWLCRSWDEALREAERVAGELDALLYVGASMLSQSEQAGVHAEPAGASETKAGLPLLRQLVTEGVVVHDGESDELNTAMAAAKVREAPTGLVLAASGPAHLVKALAWAVLAAHEALGAGGPWVCA